MLARSISEFESEEFFETLCRSFDLDIFLARPIFRQDPFYDLSHKIALFDDSGKIVSVLTLVPLSMRIAGGQVIPIAGIASVGAPPDHRKKGYASKLISETMKSLRRDRTFPIAALETQHPEFYKRFGFEQCSRVSQWEASIEDFACKSELPPPRILSRSEMLLKIDLFRRACDRIVMGRTGVFLRDYRRWETIFSFRLNFLTAICESEGDIAGYLVFAPPDSEGVIEILELAAESGKTLNALSQFISDYPGALSARGSLNNAGLAAFGINRMVSAQWDELPGFMAALVDPVEALNIVAKGSHSWSALSTLDQGFSVRLRDYRETVRIQIKRCCHGAHAAQIEGESDDADWIETNRYGLIQLILGSVSPQALAAEGKLKASSQRCLDAAAKLFPETDPFLAPLDSF